MALYCSILFPSKGYLVSVYIPSPVYFHPNLRGLQDSCIGRALEWHSRGQRFDPAYLHQNEDLCSRKNTSPRFSTPSKRQAFIQIRKSSEQLNSPSTGQYLSLTQERYRPFLFSQKNRRGNRSSNKLIQNNTPNDNKVIIRHKTYGYSQRGVVWCGTTKEEV